jgi:hypothetical protein
VTTGTLEEMHREMLPHTDSPDLALSDFHLFGSVKEALEGKDLQKTMKLNSLCNNG